MAFESQGFERAKMLPYVATYLAYASLTVTRFALSVSKSSLLDVAPFAGSDGLTLLGSLDTVFLGCYALGSLFGSSLVDRYDARWILVGSMVSSSIFTCCVAIPLQSYAYYLLLFAVMGLAQSLGWPACLSLLGVRPTGLALGLWCTHSSVGGVVGKLLGAWLLVEWGWRGVFAGLGLLLLLATVSVLLLLFQLPVDEEEREAAFAPPPAAWCTAAKIPGLWWFASCCLCVKFTIYLLLSWLPIYLASLGYSDSASSLLASAYDVGGAVGGIATGYLLDRYGQAGRLCCPCLVAAAGFLLGYSWLGEELPWQVVILFLLGLFSNSPLTLLTGKVSTDLGRQYPDSRGTIAGIINGFGGLERRYRA